MLGYYHYRVARQPFRMEWNQVGPGREGYSIPRTRSYKATASTHVHRRSWVQDGQRDKVGKKAKPVTHIDTHIPVMSIGPPFRVGSYEHTSQEKKKKPNREVHICWPGGWGGCSCAPHRAQAHAQIEIHYTVQAKRQAGGLI